MDSSKLLQTVGEKIGQLEVALKWDQKAGNCIDLDVSAVCFSARGTLIDAAYYNQLVALRGVIVHTGDCRSGGKVGNEERIKVDLSRMTDVAVVVFLLSAFTGGDLGSCAQATCDVLYNSALLSTIDGTDVNSGSASSLILCMVFRHPSTSEWHFSEIRKAASGRHFSACLVSIRQVVNRVLGPDGVQDCTLAADKTFTMDKGDVLEIPVSIRRLYVGLGWTAKGEGIDLDASCIMLTRTDNGLLTPVDMAYFQDQIRPGVQHLGDNTTGEGDGDDERILIDLSLVEDHVMALAIVVTIFNPQRSFKDVADSYVRLLDGTTGHVYARFDLHDQLSKSAVVFCVLNRSASTAESWTLLTVGEEVSARTGRMLRSHLWDSYFAAPGQRLTRTPADLMVDPTAPAPFDVPPTPPPPPPQPLPLSAADRPEAAWDAPVLTQQPPVAAHGGFQPPTEDAPADGSSDESWLPSPAFSAQPCTNRDKDSNNCIERV